MISRPWIRSVATAVACLMLPAGPRAQPPKTLALVGGMLLTGYDVPPVHHAAVVLEGNRIVQAGPASEVRIPPDATIIDTSGRTILPGLIETHAHLVILGHGDYGRDGCPARARRGNRRAHPRRFRRHGAALQSRDHPRHRQRGPTVVVSSSLAP